MLTRFILLMGLDVFSILFALTLSYSLKFKLNKIADIHNSTPSQIALSWLVSFNSNVFAIPGATNSTQAVDNAKALKINLSKEEIRKLDLVSKKIRNV